MHPVLATISYLQFPLGSVLFLFCVVATHDFPGRQMLTRAALWMFCSAAALVRIVSLESHGVYWVSYSGTRWVYDAWFLGTLVAIVLLCIFFWVFSVRTIKDWNRPRLPDHLHDPLYAARPIWIFFLCAALIDFASMYALVSAYAGFQANSSAFSWVASVGCLGAVLSFVLWLFPRTPTTALLLRRFDSDSQSDRIQRSIRRALGGDLRLSGIREPRRRVSMVVRAAFMIAMIFRYARTRFMNLEAGPDWRARLWRSLAESRVVFLDIREMTENVRFELQLAYRCIGLSRICFIGDVSKSAAEWNQRIREEMIGDGLLLGTINVALWDSSARASFEQEVKAVVSGLPTEPQGTVMETYSSIASWVPSNKEVLMRLGLDFVAATVGVALLALAVCIGRTTPAGWFREEIERALNRQTKDPTFRVIPVILPDGDSSIVDNFLELRTWVVFGNGLDDRSAFHLLTCGVRGIPPGRSSASGLEVDLDVTMIREKLTRLRALRIERLIDDDIALEYQRRLLDQLMTGRG